MQIVKFRGHLISALWPSSVSGNCDKFQEISEFIPGNLFLSCGNTGAIRYIWLYIHGPTRNVLDAAQPATSLDFGTLKKFFFNYIDHVSHYFRKIWPLPADEMNTILKWNYYLSFETGFSRFAMAKVVVILTATLLVHGWRAAASLKTFSGAAAHQPWPAGRTVYNIYYNNNSCIYNAHISIQRGCSRRNMLLLPQLLDTISRPHIQCTISTPEGAFLAELPIVALQANTYTTYPSHPTGYPFIHLGGEQQCG